MTIRRQPHALATIRRFEEVDWDFPAQASESPFSDIHWHPCRFPSQVPAIAIGRFSEPGDVVLDPFMGSGSTLVEAQRLGRDSVGFDINPVACLQARAKLIAKPWQEIETNIHRAMLRLSRTWDELEPLAAPKSVQLRKWYTPKTIYSLEKLWRFLSTSRGINREILEAAFSSILMPCCREDRHWGYICDNTMPKSVRERDVRSTFVSTLVKLAAAYKNRDQRLSTGKLGRALVIHGDSRSLLDSAQYGEFSCFVTSPPYLGVADYVKSQRLSMEWFEKDIEEFRTLEIGARSKRHRKVAAEEYLWELEQVFSSTYKALRRGAWGVIVFGQSPARQSVQDNFIRSLEGIGFQIFSQETRQISDMRRQFPSLKRESVLLVRKVRST